MKLINVRRVALIVVLAVASVEIARGLINPFSFDIFADCINGSIAPDSFNCEYAPQVMINGLGGLLMFLFSFVFMYKSTRWVKALAPAFFGISLLIFQMAIWRFELSLADNFMITTGPETITDYLYLVLLSLDGVIVGLAIGALYTLGNVMNRNALPETGRRAPRDSLAGSLKKMFGRKK